VSDPATVVITINPVNDAPAVSDQMMRIDWETPTDITLQAVDVEGDPFTYVIVEYPAHGSVLSDDGDANITYVPDPGFFGQDTIRFKADDGFAEENIGELRFVVTPIYRVFVLPGGTSRPYAVNDIGQVVGSTRRDAFGEADLYNRAFLWESGTMTDLGTLGGTSSWARDINNLGEIIGKSIGDGNFLWRDGLSLRTSTWLWQ